MQIENHKEEEPFAHNDDLFHNFVAENATTRLSDVTWDG